MSEESSGPFKAHNCAESSHHREVANGLRALLRHVESSGDRLAEQVEFFKVSYVRKTGYTHIDNAPVWWILTGIQQSIYYAVYATMVILTAGSEGGFFRAVG